jgi:hypothetical protein
MSRWKRIACLLLTAMTLFGLVLTAAAVPAGAVSQAQLKSKALSLSDMPTGWSVDNSSSGGTSNLGGCLKNLQALGRPAKGIARVQVKYTDQTVPSLQETLESGKGAAKRYEKYLSILNGCKSISITSGTTQFTGSVGAMSFPTIGNSSSAFAINLTADGVSVGIDLILFRVGQIDGDMVYEDYSPDTSVVQSFATNAVDKIEGHPTTPPTTF